MDMPAHQLSMSILMTPDTANFAGNVHGGTILKLLDQVAYACASRYAGRLCRDSLGRSGDFLRADPSGGPHEWSKSVFQLIMKYRLKQFAVQ